MEPTTTISLAEMQARENVHGDTKAAQAAHEDRKARRDLINLRAWPGLGMMGECPDCLSTQLILDNDFDDEDQAA